MGDGEKIRRAQAAGPAPKPLGGAAPTGPIGVILLPPLAG